MAKQPAGTVGPELHGGLSLSLTNITKIDIDHRMDKLLQFVDWQLRLGRSG